MRVLFIRAISANRAAASMKHIPLPLQGRISVLGGLNDLCCRLLLFSSLRSPLRMLFDIRFRQLA